MPLSRTEVLLAVTNLLEDKVPPSKIYEWALAQAMAKDYDTAVQEDPLLGETIQILIDYNHQHGTFIPTKEDLVYYQKCLQGDADFEPLSTRLEKIKKARQIALEKQKAQQQKVKAAVNAAAESTTPSTSAPTKTLPRKIMRVYVILFALTSLIVNITGIVKPGYYRPEDVVTQGEALKEAIPHFFYVLFLLIPPQILARGILSYFALPIFFIGTIFYFYITVSMVFQLKLNPLLILAFAPFSLIPALLALWLLITEKKN